MRIAIAQLQYNTDLIFKYVKEAIMSNVELICFPEMALCGYSLENIEENEIKQRPIIDELKDIATKNSICISIGGIEKSEENNSDYYISQYIINNSVETYRKTHLGQLEQTVFKQGDDIPVFKYKDITIGIMCCYDGHFPELATKLVSKGANILLNPSASGNTAEKRVRYWKKYLNARAYDNRVWVLANNLLFRGKGGGILVYDGRGEIVKESIKTEATMSIIDYSPITYRSKGMCLRDFKLDRRDDLYG